MRMRHTFSSLGILIIFIGLVISHFGCDGVTTPDKVIIDNSLNLPGIVMTSLTDSSEPALVGIGTTFNITWTLTGNLDNPNFKLFLAKKKDAKDADLIDITSSGQLSYNKEKKIYLFIYSPNADAVTTGIDYYVVVQLWSGGNLFDKKVANQQLRISDGGIILTTPASGNETIARGESIDVIWSLTNDICDKFKNKAKSVKLYVSTASSYNSKTAIEVTDPEVALNACDKEYIILTGEITGLKLNKPYYVIARLFIDGKEACRSTSPGTFTTHSSINVTAPAVDVTSDFSSIPVSWEVIGISNLTGLKVDILAKIAGDEDDNVIRVISSEFPADQNRGLADASKLPSGSYEVVVRLFKYDDEGAKIILDTASATGKVLINSGYNGSYDLADMSAIEERNYSPINGVVFEGFNINEQAGYDVAGVGDITGDGYADFLIFSRFFYQYTAGNSGGAYLIRGKETFDKKIINVNSIASPNADARPVDGSILMLPMENLASLDAGSGYIYGGFSAIGLPDVSGDGIGDLFIGCPDAAPLIIEYDNNTTTDVSLIDQYGLARTVAAGSHGIEPAHVEPHLEFHACPYGDTTIDYILDYYGDASSNYTYAPGDTIRFVFSDIGGSVFTHVYVDHYGDKRGTTYLVTSQRLTQYNNEVYELDKIGSPVEDGVSDTSLQPVYSGSYIFSTNGTPERCEMTTWEDTECRWGANISVMGDINGDGYPNTIVTISNATVYDVNGQDTSDRTNAGFVRITGGNIRHTSIWTQVGRISRLWPVYNGRNGEGRNSDGSDWELDIIGSETNSNISAAIGLGKFIETLSTDGKTIVTKYVNGDYNKDGVPDLVVGAPGEASNAGSIYIVPARKIFGRRASVIDLADFNSATPVGTNTSIEVPVLGVKVVGTIAGERLGEVVKPAGDFNGDGLADVMFATPKANAEGMPEAGRVFIMFGQKDQIGNFTLDQVDSHLGTQLPALIFEGGNAQDHFGTRIVAVYDVNNDGLDDILVAAPDADAPGKDDCGKIYLIYGKKNIIKTDPATKFKYVDYDGDGKPDDFWSAQDIGVKLPGAVFIGEAAGNHLQAVSPAFDVNQDGIADFIIGAPNTDINSVQTSAGKAYLIFGEKYVLPN